MSLLAVWLFGCGIAGIERTLLLAAPPVPLPSTADRALLDTYCVGCHNAALRTAGVQLDTADPANVGLDPRLWEGVARVLRTR